MIEAPVVTRPQGVCTTVMKSQYNQKVEAPVVTRPQGVCAAVTKPQWLKPLLSQNLKMCV